MFIVIPSEKNMNHDCHMHVTLLQNEASQCVILETVSRCHAVNFRYPKCDDQKWSKNWQKLKKSLVTPHHDYMALILKPHDETLSETPSRLWDTYFESSRSQSAIRSEGSADRPTWWNWRQIWKWVGSGCQLRFGDGFRVGFGNAFSGRGCRAAISSFVLHTTHNFMTTCAYDS